MTNESEIVKAILSALITPSTDADFKAFNVVDAIHAIADKLEENVAYGLGEIASSLDNVADAIRYHADATSQSPDDC